MRHEEIEYVGTEYLPEKSRNKIIQSEKYEITKSLIVSVRVIYSKLCDDYT
jgi:hypothetical protein